MNAANVIVGPASMTYKRSGGIATDVGFTQGGIMIRLVREYLDVLADQVVGVIRKSKTKEQLFVKTKLLESSFEHMSIAWDQPAPVGNEGQLGQNNAVANELELVITGPAPNGATRTFTLLRCVSVAEGEYSWSREAESGMEVEFEAIKLDGTGGTELGTFGTVIDSSALTITTASPLAAQESGVEIDPDITLATSGHTGAVAWEIVSGVLPAGVAFSTGGVISGTPTQEGVFEFTVKATDTVPLVAIKQFQITVT